MLDYSFKKNTINDVLDLTPDTDREINLQDPFEKIDETNYNEDSKNFKYTSLKSDEFKQDRQTTQHTQENVSKFNKTTESKFYKACYHNTKKFSKRIFSYYSKSGKKHILSLNNQCVMLHEIKTPIISFCNERSTNRIQ